MNLIPKHQKKIRTNLSCRIACSKGPAYTPNHITSCEQKVIVFSSRHDFFNQEMLANPYCLQFLPISDLTVAIGGSTM